MTEVAMDDRLMLIEIDDERYINKTRLAKLLQVPQMDVSIGMCYLQHRGYTRYGHRMYDKVDAIKEMRGYYLRMYAEKKVQFKAHHSEMYRDHALKYKARMETCDMVLAALGTGGDADG